MSNKQIRLTAIACGLIICLGALIVSRVLYGESMSEKRNNFVFSGEASIEHSVKRGVFLHDWKTNTNEKLSDDIFWSMSYSENKDRIVALDENLNIMELDLAANKTNCLLTKDEIKELLRVDNYSRDDFKQAHVYYHQDGVLIDVSGSIYYLRNDGDRWKANKIEGTPPCKEFFLIDDETILLKSSNFDLYDKDPDETIEYYLYDIQTAACKKLFESIISTHDVFGDVNNMCLDSARNRIAYIEDTDTESASIRIYNLEKRAKEETNTDIKAFGSGTLTYRGMYLLLDSGELICGRAESGWSSYPFLLSEGKEKGLKGIKDIYCCAI